MVGSGESKLVNRLIPAGIAIGVLLVAVVLSSSLTEYGVEHAVDIEHGSTSFSETFSFTVGPLSSWRSHVLELYEEFTQRSRVEKAESPLITINAYLTVNGVEAEGFTHSIDAFQGGSRSVYQLLLPRNLLRLGENNVTLTYRIEVERPTEPAAGIELIYSGYRIKTS